MPTKKLTLILLFISLSIFVVVSLISTAKAQAKPDKTGMPYATAWSCLNLTTNQFSLHIRNDGNSKGLIGTMERFYDNPDNWVDWGNFSIGKTKVHYIGYETRDSWVSAFNPETKTWVVQGWYTLNRQEHINLGWICQ